MQLQQKSWNLALSDDAVTSCCINEFQIVVLLIYYIQCWRNRNMAMCNVNYTQYESHPMYLHTSTVVSRMRAHWGLSTHGMHTPDLPRFPAEI